MSRNAGYSLIEAIFVVALVTFGSSAALVQLQSSVKAIDADVASATVVSQMKYARQVAINSRYSVLVEFISPATIRLTQFGAGGSSTVISNVTLPTGITFGLASGLGDTPEGYGNASAVHFNGATSGTFLADGVFVNNAGIVVSGTVFTIGSGTGSARAVTLSGPNGRLKQYYVRNNAWTEKRALGSL